MTRVNAVRERPIVFAPEMVRAILDGRKTQTRRIMRPQPPRIAGLYARGGRWYLPPGEPAALPFPRCPYGQPGDRLWVRETWGWRGSMYSVGADHKDQIIEYRADRERRYISRPISRRGRDGLPRHRARRPGESEQEYRHYLHRFWSAWRPSIHMPRWASRITLEITDVRVERVQDITDADCYAEGLPEDEPSAFEDAEMAQVAGLHIPEGSAERHWFRVGWDRLNARRGYGWETNPWVWVLTFRSVRP